MYPVVLVVHSWLRYAVLALGLALLVASFVGWRRGDAFTPRHNRLHATFLGVLDLQLLLGLWLYCFLSPIPPVAWQDMAGSMKDPVLRFFGVEHIGTMLVAIAIAHVGRTRSKRKEGSPRHRLVFWIQLLWLALTASVIPWPPLDVGRPLFRL